MISVNTHGLDRKEVVFLFLWSIVWESRQYQRLTVGIAFIMPFLPKKPPTHLLNPLCCTWILYMQVLQFHIEVNFTLALPCSLIILAVLLWFDRTFDTAVGLKPRTRTDNQLVTEMVLIMHCLKLANRWHLGNVNINIYICAITLTQKIHG